MGPGDRGDVVALRATFGLLLSRDGGRTFVWMCEEAMLWPAAAPPSFDPAVELAAGAVVFAGLDGLRSTGDGCDLGSPLAGTVIADLARHASTGALFAVESNPGARNAVYRAGADAARFERIGEGAEGMLFDTVEVAPSDARRLYLSGRDTAAYRARVYRSDDGGAALARMEAGLGAADTAWVSGVDPRDADTVFVRTTVGAGAELWRSRDGARTFRRLAATDDPMLGFALSDDGRTVWVGGVVTGLLRSDDGGDSFSPVNRLPVLCLRQHRGVLWACSDGTEGPFALGRSADGGARFEPVLRFEDGRALPGPRACEPATPASAVCAARWPALRAELTASAPTDAGAARDAGPSRDAGSPAAPPPAEGCACSALPPRASSPARGALAIVLAARVARRRQRARRQPRGRATSSIR